jgi:peptidyl-prolyl cis-trans isomerase SurA
MPHPVSLARRLYATTTWMLALLLLGSAFAHPAQAQQEGAQGDVVDQIAAVVGDNIILTSEVDQLVRQRAQQQGTSYSQDLWMQGLQNLIDQQVLSEEARRDTTLTISDEQLSSQLNRQIERFKERAGGKEQLERMYGKSILEIKETFRDDLRDQLLAQRLRQRRMQDINVTPSEVRQFYESIPQDSLPDLPKTVRLSHVVRYPKPSTAAREEARNIITTIRDSIVNKGASFEAMARQFSDDAGTAANGGLIENVSLDELVPEFAAVASRTPVGQVSQVFYNDSRDGYHIMRVNSRSGGTISFNHVLVRINPDATEDEQATQYLNAVRDTLKNYEVPFELMARRHSEDERSSENGGRVTDPQSGTRDLVLDALNTSWRSTTRELEEGEISEPSEVELLNGDRAYHIVKLERRTPAHTVNLEMDYQRIRELALQQKRQRKMQEWLDELREDIYVDVRVSENDLTAMRQRP